MTTICQKCGVKGFEELLVFCKKCQISVEHRYCLDKTPKLEELEVHWLCEQCSMTVSEIDTSDSVIVRGRKEWAMRHRHRRSSCTDLLQRIKYRHQKNLFISNPSPNIDKPSNGTSRCLEKDVPNVAMISKESKSIDIQQGDLLLSGEKNGVHPKGEECECLGNEIDVRKLKKKRKLILGDDSDEDAPPLKPVDNCTVGVPDRSITQLNKPFTRLPSPQNYGCDCFCASPIVHPGWRGYFNICDGKYGPVVAHLSNRACEKVCNMADMLPQVLNFERLPRVEAWPKSFKCSVPTDDNIALYFFPGDVRAKGAVGQLLDDVIEKDQALKVIVDKAELLVFPSMLLPQRCHLFEGERYLWGVFRARQALRHATPPDIHLPRLSEAAGPADEHQQHYSVCKDVPTDDFASLNGGVGGNESGGALRESQAPTGQFPDVFGGSKAPARQVPDKYPPKLNEVECVEEPVGDALLRGEASKPCLSPDEPSGLVEVVNKPVAKSFESNVEFNLRGEYVGEVDSSLAVCLKLFPLDVEDLGIIAKVRDSEEVDLELGLEMVKDRNYDCKPAVKEDVVFLFGRSIY